MQKAHTLLFSCSQSVLAAGIQQNQPGTEQNASDNITQPVHAGNQPPHNHKGGECRQQGKKNVQNSRPAVNCTPFVRQYGILSNKWGVLLCQKEYQTNDIRRNSKNW